MQAKSASKRWADKTPEERSAEMSRIRKCGASPSIRKKQVEVTETLLRSLAIYGRPYLAEDVNSRTRWSVTIEPNDRFLDLSSAEAVPWGRGDTVAAACRDFLRRIAKARPGLLRELKRMLLPVRIPKRFPSCKKLALRR